jgi:chromosome segregation ATPase
MPKTLDQVRLPDMKSILADQEKLYHMQQTLNSKVQANYRLRDKNNVMKEQIEQLEFAVKQYKQRIKDYEVENKQGTRIIEVPCNHAETID